MHGFPSIVVETVGELEGESEGGIDSVGGGAVGACDEEDKGDGHVELAVVLDESHFLLDHELHHEAEDESAEDLTSELAELLERGQESCDGSVVNLFYFHG